MKLQEAKTEFIQNWGAIGTNWGISKTMAQVHALLLVSNKPLNSDDIMSELGISRGNTNMTVRSLMDWRLVEKVVILGERKEFFKAEKDVWKIVSRIASERRKRELEPVQNLLSKLEKVEADEASKEEAAEFERMMKSLKKFTDKVDRGLSKVGNGDESWFINTLLKMM